MNRGIWALTMIGCLVLAGCSINSKPTPKPNDYAVSFSIDNSSSFLSPIKGQYQSQFNVDVSKWNQDYDTKNYEVFLIVTDKTSPVIDLESDNANNFAYGGWSNLRVENSALKSLGLQAIENQGVPNNWFNVLNGTETTARFIARTKTPADPSDWRFVIMAMQSDSGSVKVLWTEAIAPSKETRG